MPDDYVDWRGWDTETFTVIRHHHEAAIESFVLTSKTTMNPVKTKQKRGEETTRN